jgi:hypothetical protein
MVWSLRARRSGIGSDSWRRTGDGGKQIRDSDQGVDRDDGIGDDDHGRASLP